MSFREIGSGDGWNSGLSIRSPFLSRWGSTRALSVIEGNIFFLVRWLWRQWEGNYPHFIQKRKHAGDQSTPSTKWRSDYSMNRSAAVTVIGSLCCSFTDWYPLYCIVVPRKRWGEGEFTPNSRSKPPPKYTIFDRKVSPSIVNCTPFVYLHWKHCNSFIKSFEGNVNGRP